jgi:hypothetical protein
MYARYSALVGTMALSFQVFVLEPWHKQISNELKELAACTSNDADSKSVHSKPVSASPK